MFLKDQAIYARVNSMLIHGIPQSKVWSNEFGEKAMNSPNSGLMRRT